MDLDAAAKHGFAVGETYDVVAPTGATELTLTGLISFGENNDTLGATLMQLDLDTLQALTGQVGYDSVVLAVTTDVDRGLLEAELAALAPDVEIVDKTTLESEQRADFNEGIDIIGNVLLGFAAISLFVSIFIIYNTFSIVLGQRTKELALLRTVGADPKQLRRAVLAEAGVIGVVSSAVGVGAGVLMAFGLRGLFDLLGATLPDSPVVITTRTMLVAAAIVRHNQRTEVVPFATDIVKARLNPRDSVMTNARKLASLPSGGTNCSAPLRHLNRRKAQGDLIIYVSDNESWVDSPYYGHWGGGATETMKQWKTFKNRNENAKMICIDIQPYATTQAPERRDIVNVGGFTDQVFRFIADVAAGGTDRGHWVRRIDEINL